MKDNKKSYETLIIIILSVWVGQSHCHHASQIQDSSGKTFPYFIDLILNLIFSCCVICSCLFFLTLFQILKLKLKLKLRLILSTATVTVMRAAVEEILEEAVDTVTEAAAALEVVV